MNGRPSRDSALILYSGVCVVSYVVALVALAVAGVFERDAALAAVLVGALSPVIGVAGVAIGRLSGANQVVGASQDLMLPGESF